MLCAAQVLATLAILLPVAEDRQWLLTQAESFSGKAAERAPESAWVLAAKAWVAFAQGYYQDASRSSERAVELGPNDPHIVEFDTLISLYTGNFERVISESKRMEALVTGTPGFVFRNATGSARYHLGDYIGSIEAFEKSIANGGPVGPPMLAYLMAANQKLGRSERAQELASQYSETWPEARFDLVLGRLFAEKAYVDDVVSAMRMAGWSEN